MSEHTRQIIVMHYPAQPHFFSFGGFDIQMNRIIEMTNRGRVATKKVDLWAKKESFDIAHFWGASDSHKLNIGFCKENGIKVIISGLFPQKTFKNKLKIKLLQSLRRFIRCESVVYIADIITVINEEQAEVLAKYYGYPQAQIRIIPTILDDYLFKDHKTGIPKEDFILCVGTICSRKNQVILAETSLELGIKCVFVGRFDSREPLFQHQFLKTQNINNGLIEHLEDITIEDLCNLYLKCSVVSCLSQNETEPATILEAMHFQKPIIASNLPFAKLSKFKGVILCDQNNIKSIKNGLVHSLKQNGTKKYSSFDSKTHQSESVLKLYNDLYLDIANKD